MLRLKEKEEYRSHGDFYLNLFISYLQERRLSKTAAKAR
jgi:hypothetical protein